MCKNETETQINKKRCLARRITQKQPKIVIFHVKKTNNHIEIK